MDETVKGKRVKLIQAPDLLLHLQPGDMGTAVHQDDMGMLYVKWDKGHQLSLHPALGDEWEWIKEIDHG
jgi:hypothetical protein